MDKKFKVEFSEEEKNLVVEILREEKASFEADRVVRQKKDEPQESEKKLSHLIDKISLSL